MIWHKEALDIAKVKELSIRYNLSALEASLLYRRKLTEEKDLAFFLEDNLSFTHSPFLFHDMTSVIERLATAAEEGEKVLIFGDKDVDGMTSTTIASHMLRTLGIRHETRIPLGEELYGLTESVVEDCFTGEITLIVTVDCGISAYPAIERANELGIEVIVLDHHLAQTMPLVPALAIINPNVEGSGYPFPYLAGCGVVTKVFWATLFARTPLYNIDFCFVHLEPSQPTHLYLVHSLNGLPQSTCVLDLAQPELLPRLAQFTEGKWLVALSRNEIMTNFTQLFGNRFAIEIQDLQAILAVHMPAIQGKSLNEIIALSRRMRYEQTDKTTQEQTLQLMGFFFSEVLLMSHRTVFAPYENILDLTAMGTLADMMPLQNENRLLVKRGLKQLSQTKHKGLRALISLKNLQGRPLKACNVSWEITPLLNSAGRMGQAYRSLNLLLCDNMDDAFVQAREIMSLNRKRKSLETKIWEASQETIQQSYWNYNKKLVLLLRDDIPKGLTGILASRMMRTYHTPAVVLSRQDNLIKGSLRAPEGFSTQDFLGQIKDSLVDFGGHNSVAGFSLTEENLPLLFERLKTFAFDESRALVRPPLRVDAFLPSTAFNPELLRIVSRFEPFGKGCEDFVFEVHNVFLENFNFIGDSSKNHSVILSVRGATHRFQSIYWNGWSQLERLDLTPQTPVNLVFKFQESFYKGQVSQRLSILDIKRPEESPPLQKD